MSSSNSADQDHVLFYLKIHHKATLFYYSYCRIYTYSNLKRQNART
uniref:Uncharacterized protein n=1 Tax=Arundo donax TaxID=35708 RepID=A0A0A9C5P1_ARUDO